jgi:putative two-component system response regulator
VPATILSKPGALTPSELAVVRGHAEAGAAMLTGEGELLALAREIALTHHERWDGAGYPRGLRGREIPIAGRIVAVADVYDALTHMRPYKPAWPRDIAVAEVAREAGRQFDPAVVDAFLAVLGERRPPRRVVFRPDGVDALPDPRR